MSSRGKKMPPNKPIKNIRGIITPNGTIKLMENYPCDATTRLRGGGSGHLIGVGPPVSVEDGHVGVKGPQVAVHVGRNPLPPAIGTVPGREKEPGTIRQSARERNCVRDGNGCAASGPKYRSTNTESRAKVFFRLGSHIEGGGVNKIGLNGQQNRAIIFCSFSAARDVDAGYKMNT